MVILLNRNYHFVGGILSFSFIVVDTSAGTFAAFYYKNIRQFDTPTKDHMVSYGQDEKFTVGGFDVSNIFNLFSLRPRDCCCYPLGFWRMIFVHIYTIFQSIISLTIVFLMYPLIILLFGLFYSVKYMLMLKDF